MAKVNAGLKIEDVMKFKLEFIAEKEGLAYADLCRIIFFNYIKEYEKDYGAIQTDTNK